MRAWVLPLLAAPLLTGCASGPSEPGDGFSPTCPSWVEGLGTMGFRTLYDQEATPPGPHAETVGEGLLWDDGRPLDKVLLDFGDRPRGNGTEEQGVVAQDSRLELRAHRKGDGQPLLLYDPARGPRGGGNPGQPAWTFEPGRLHNDVNLQLDVADPDGPARPDAVVLEWTWVRDLDGRPDTRSSAVAYYTARFLYRTC